MSVALRSSDTPAEAAAKLLIRLGLATLFLGLPCAGVFWRGAIYVLFPVGAVLVLFGGLLDTPRQMSRRLWDALTSPAVVAALFVGLWAGLSLIWTPFAAEAGERFLQSSGAALVAGLAAVYLPQRTKPVDLYLLPAGLALASVSTIILAFIDPPWFFGGFAFDETLFERSLISAIVLVWPALGLLVMREHWGAAAILAVLVTAVAFAGFAQIALVAMGAGAFVFAVAMSSPAKVARVCAWLFASLIILSPVIPLLFQLILWLTGIEAGAAFAPMLIWSDLVASQWPRLITGHGFDFVHWGLNFGYLPARTPTSFLFVLWYDFGVVGAGGFAVLLMLLLREAGQIQAGAAAAVLGGLAAVMTIVLLGIATSQIWWLTLLACDVIAFALLVKSVDRSKRPDVEAIRATGTEAALPPRAECAAISRSSAV
ncbi:MAG: hypothetical protein L0Y50_06005 [Beijerinckiaceae bacterium]|nr:hypothetical protein [Beijerinckiaceae bacterium]MCI0735813.1 hypothetical protein [Beijerinckiaceae bacterium]